MRIRTVAVRRLGSLVVKAIAVLTAVALASACVGKGAADGGAGNAEKATLTFWTINLKKNFDS